MIVDVCESLKSALQPIQSNFSSLCGMSKLVHSTFFSKKAEHYDVFPVPYNDDNVLDNNSGLVFSLIPKKRGISAIGYFEETNNVEVYKNSEMKICGIDFICWYNKKYFPNQNIESVFPTTVLELFMKRKSGHGVVSNIIVESAKIASVEDSMNILRKNTVLYQEQNLLVNPYGFFSISLNINFTTNDCISQISLVDPECK